MKARIKPGVRPYGGRTFEVIRRGTSSIGREWVEIGVPSARTKFGLLGATVSARTYYLDEVELIEEVKR